MKESADLKKLEEKIREREIDTAIVCTPDTLGRLAGIRIDAVQLMQKNKWRVREYLLGMDLACRPIAGCTGTQATGSFCLQPDMETLRCIPWLPATALVLCNLVHPEGRAVVQGPRELLRKQVERARQWGFQVEFGTRLDCYVFESNYDDARAGSYRNLTRKGVLGQAYNILEGGRQESLIRAVRTQMVAANVPVEESVSGRGAGQHVAALSDGVPMEAADRHVLYKHGVKELAALHDRSVTFLAQWSDGFPGSSCTISGFLRSDNTEKHTQLHHCFLAGQLKLAREMCLFFAPFANSYRRFASQGDDFCRLVWRQDDCNAPLRLMGRGDDAHLEWEWGGADINPYLAFAAIIAAGLHGVEQNLPLPPAGKTVGSKDETVLPRSLEEATDALDESITLREAFGAEAVNHYIAAALWEIGQQQGESGSPEFLAWQVQRGFEQA